MRYVFAWLMCLSLSAQTPPARPKVFGVAHYSIFVSDLAKARAFYEDFLGYEEAFTLPKPDGTVQMVFIKINDHQYVEMVNQPNQGEGQLNHLGLYTDDVARMRQYLVSRGVDVPASRSGAPTSRSESGAGWETAKRRADRRSKWARRSEP